MTLTTQFYTMLAMIGMGSLFGAAFDTYNRLFKRSQKKVWIVFIYDILFWLFQGLLIFYVLYLVNNGEIRVYIFLALLCGFAFYQSLLQSVYNQVLEFCIQVAVKSYYMVVKVISLFIFKPVTITFAVLLSIGIFLGKLFISILQMFWRIALNIIKIILSPFTYLLNILWNIIPKSIKIKVARFCKTILNSFNWLSRLFKKRKNE